MPSPLDRVVRLLLAPSGLSPAPPRSLLLRALERAAGPAGRVVDLVHDGDPREPARLRALFASRSPRRGGPALLFLHGKGGSGAEFRGDAARALSLGYDVLVPELRGHAPSGGRHVTYGWLETGDVEALLRAARERVGLDLSRVGVDGVSMGALVALQLASGGTTSGPLWLQAPFGDLPGVAARYLSRATGLPASLLALPARLATFSAERALGVPLSAVDPLAAARSVRCPAVVVIGETDAFVPLASAEAVHRALAGEATLWRVPRAGHAHHPDEPQSVARRAYLERWTAFFTRHLPPGRPPRRTAARRPSACGA
ncbi:MAG: alpha/beta fold hydrolase [Acidobacteria bacterium]|nr:MAG: alpha/beta fold hydrolase [Acidobacteriota bacterium]